MAIGDSQDEGHGFIDMKSSLPLLQVPRANSTGNIFGGHLPLAPAGLRSNNFLDTRPETQHHFQTALGTPVDHVVSPFQGLTFTQGRGRGPSPSPRQTGASATFTIHGLDNLSHIELEWSIGSCILPDQRARIERCVLDVLSGADCSQPIARRDPSCDGSRRSSWAPDSETMTHRFVSQDARGRGRQRQSKRLISPEDMDEMDAEYMPLDIVPRIHVRLGDKQAVLAYYDSILRSIQQLALKSILKAWISEIEPKKQKNFPYNHPTKRPRWWPSNAQYKEPDHIQLNDRILVAVAIIHHAQNPDELDGNGLGRLEEVAATLKLVYDCDKEKVEKPKFRKALLKSLFELAKAEERYLYEEEDPSYTISLPQVTKYERPNKNKKRKRDLTKDTITNSPSSNMPTVKYENLSASNGLLEPGTLRSQDDRASTAPNTPSWSHSHESHDSGVDFTRSDQGHPAHMIQFSQPFEQPTAMVSQYSSFDGNTIHGVNSSPESAYPSSTTSASSIHMSYPHGVSMGYTPSAQGMPSMQGQHDGISGMMYPAQTRPEDTQSFIAMTETGERSWTATPATYMPPQPPHYPPAGYY